MTNRTQVISTSRRPLISMVVGGDFLPSLYYRLNMVYIDLTAGALYSSGSFHGRRCKSFRHE